MANYSDSAKLESDSLKREILRDLQMLSRRQLLIICLVLRLDVLFTKIERLTGWDLPCCVKLMAFLIDLTDPEKPFLWMALLTICGALLTMARMLS